MSQRTRPAISALAALGLTSLEAEAYVALLENSPATGYRVAQIIGRTAANTYAALESLESKGAILVEEGSTRMCRAVPPEQFLAQLARQFEVNGEKAQKALAHIPPSDPDHRIYDIKNATHVFERFREMLAKAEQLVLIDVFPDPLSLLEQEIQAAASRGVTVGVLVYAPVKIERATVVVQTDAKGILERWDGQWANIVVDASEHLLALLSHDLSEVRHAAWSANTFLAHLYHSGLYGEISAAALRNAIEAKQSTRSLRALMRRLGRLNSAGLSAYVGLSSAVENGA